MHTFGAPRTYSSLHFPPIQRPLSYDDIEAEFGDARAGERPEVPADGHLNRSPVTPFGEPEGIEMGSSQHRVPLNHNTPTSTPTQSSTFEALFDSSRARDNASQRSEDAALLEPGEGGLPTRPNSILSSARRNRYTGWRAGAATCTSTAAAVLIVNTVLTIWATYSFPMQDGIGTLIDGNCSRVKTWGLWLHFAINALSTLLLGASNYCMQYLTSPTRQEIDNAHATRIWLDIGVQSVRNLRHISWVRVLLWSLLGLSSVPLHLMYNSTVFEALSANEYNVLVVTEGFLSGAPWSHGSVLPNPSSFSYSHPPPPNMEDLYPPPHYTSPAPTVTVQRLQDNIKALERLENAACMKAYQNPLVSDRRNLLAVTSAKPVNSSNLLDVILKIPGVNSDQSKWICSFLPRYADAALWVPCDVDLAIQNADSWKVANKSIEYCLSERVDEHCKLQFSKTIMVVVIVCNLLKVCCMLSAILRRSGEALVTTGDAVASFLESPDTTTHGMCLMSKRDIVNRVGRRKTKRQGIRPKIWLPERPFWFTAPSLARWLTCVILCLTALIVTGALLAQAISSPSNAASTDIGSLYRMGIGAVNIDSLFSIGPNGSESTNVLSYILVGNLPQAILSILYLMYNGLYTCMLQGHEWSGYGHERKTLRVTSPVGKQRSSYYLTLPYTYAIPLISFSGLMHWLVSQAIFLVRVTVYTENGTEDVDQNITACGYSCIAIIFVIIGGSMMLLVGVAIGFRRYKSGMPLALSCSAAISAACHPPPDDVNAAVLPLKWGAVKEEIDGVGHCSFTSREVVPPVKGRVYAGRVQDLGGMTCSELRRWT